MDTCFSVQESPSPTQPMSTLIASLTPDGTEPAPLDGFTADQRFYLAYATLWAQNIRDEEIARLTKLDVHSLGKWRVNASLRNLQDFYDAFSITDGAMFMPEEERVIIW